MFEGIDAFTQQRIHISTELGGRSLAEQANKGASPIRNVNKEAVGIISMLQSDNSYVSDLKAQVDVCIQDAVFATRIIDGFKNPTQHGANLKNHAGFPLDFFTREAQELRERLQWCKTVMEQIERKISSSSSQAPQAISAAMQAQHQTFIALAGRTAELDTEVKRLKVAYAALYKARTGIAQDPFAIENARQSMR